MTSPRAGAAMALVLGALAGAATAQDVYPNAPFREDPVTLAQAAALQRIAVTAGAWSRAPAGAEESAAEAEGEGQDGADPMAAAWPLVAASLAERAPETAAALDAALARAREARETGADQAEIAGEVAALITVATAALSPAEVVDTDPFRAALLAALLLDEGGVADSYEEAAEGAADAYAIGWTALRRAAALWDQLRARGAPDRVAEGDAALARLDALFPGADRPDRLSSDPEEAEAPAHQLVALAEEIARADLFPGRDLGAAAETVRALAAEGCAMRPEAAALGDERLAIAAAYYEALLADPVSVLAPEAQRAIAAGFEGGEAGAEAPGCDALLAALGTAREALGS